MSSPVNIRQPVRLAQSIVQRILFWDLRGYRAERYWRRRHLRYRFDMRGVGNCGLSHEANKRAYEEAKDVFLALCRSQDLNLTLVGMLDVGCGTGYHAEVFRSEGGTRYCGIDITDVLFADLQQRFPDFTFRKLDICREPPGQCFDLIVMIDVTQHITDERKFVRAMQHVRSCMGTRGVFVVTSWLDEGARRSYYEVSRSIDAYRAAFPGYQFSTPIPYRDKYMFAIRRL